MEDTNIIILLIGTKMEESRKKKYRRELERRRREKEEWIPVFTKLKSDSTVCVLEFTYIPLDYILQVNNNTNNTNNQY